MKILINLGLFGALLLAVKLTQYAGTVKTPLAESALSFGFLLLAAYVLGRAVAPFGLPRITGYLFAGIIAGPQVFGVVTGEITAPLKFASDMALMVIGILAGGTVHIKRIRVYIRGFVWTLGSVCFNSFATVFVVFFNIFFFTGMLGVAAPTPGVAEWKITLAAAGIGAVTLGIVAMASSAAEAAAVIAETKIRNEVSETIIGVTIIKNIIVVVLFALVASAAARLHSGVWGWDFVRYGILYLSVSCVTGVSLGMFVAASLRRGVDNAFIFMTGATLAGVVICTVAEIDPILTAAIIGFIAVNFTEDGDNLIETIGANSQLVLAAFFALLGQRLDLGAVAGMWPYAALMFGLRLGGIWFGGTTGETIVNEERNYGRFAWGGFISQSVLTLSLAEALARHIPGWGQSMSGIITGSALLGLLVGPALMRRGLVKSEQPQDEEPDYDTAPDEEEEWEEEVEDEPDDQAPPVSR